MKPLEPHGPVVTTLIRYDGRCDGIRFGRLAFTGNIVRQFFWDRLNRTIRLYTTQTGFNSVEDPDEARRNAALVLLTAREPIVEPKP